MSKIMFTSKATTMSISGYSASEDKRPPDSTKDKSNKKTYVTYCTKCSKQVLRDELKNGYSGSCSCGLCFFSSKKCPSIF